MECLGQHGPAPTYLGIKTRMPPGLDTKEPLWSSLKPSLLRRPGVWAPAAMGPKSAFLAGSLPGQWVLEPALGRSSPINTRVTSLPQALKQKHSAHIKNISKAH